MSDDIPTTQDVREAYISATLNLADSEKEPQSLMTGYMKYSFAHTLKV